jgi:hypothetical protein
MEKKLFVAADTAVFGSFGHLQIVYDDGSGNLDELEVLAPEGDFGFFGGEWGIRPFMQTHNDPSDADWDDDENYGIYELELQSGQSAEYVWELLGQVRESLVAFNDDLEYDTIGFESQNSNSYVRTLLDVIGNTINWEDAFASDGMDEFPGYNRNVLKDLAPFPDNGLPLTVAGTPGNDIINGGGDKDNIGGQAGDDTLRGGEGDDILSGGEGDDILSGGSGQDLFLGTTSELDGDTIRDLSIGDRIGVSGATIDPETIDSDSTTVSFNADNGRLDPFGEDVSINAVLPDGATLRLLDETLEDGGSILEVVGGGQDIAFVIDTTGSMADDIASVKASATEIIKAVFDPDRGLNDSRIAVVGFNDPTTETVLPFTNQTDPDDRKEAALNAINSLTASGGGDFPELTYTGLLRALDGRAGEWNEDAAARKIILFGDATAKDTDLRDQVIALARDLGVGVDVGASARMASFSSVDVTDDIALTTFSLASEAEDGPGIPIPVQIFTVAIGSNTSTIAEFEAIADETGGDDFRAADASEIVETLLEIINLPIYAISALSSSVEEGNEGSQTVNVTVQRDVGTTAAMAAIVLSGTSNDDDRTLAESTVSFAVGETSKTIQISIIGDTNFEPDETVVVTIASVSEPATVGTPSATITILNDDIEISDGTSGDDDIFTAFGGTDIDLVSGADVVRGPVENFFDDIITGFGLDDMIIFEGDFIAREDIEVTFGSAILAIDTDDSGNPNGSFTLEGDFSGGDFMALLDAGNTVVTFEEFLPILKEGQAIDPNLVNGIINQNFLKGDGTTDFQVTLRDMGFAGYNNTVGVYEIDGAGNIIDTRILFENANADKTAVAGITDVEAGNSLGFFIVQNAANWAATLVAGDTLSFVNGSGTAANLSDGSDLSIAVNGFAVDEMVFHSFSEDMNSGGIQHALSGIETGGEAISVGFEDLTGGGDRDYEDVVFHVEMVDDFIFV